MLDEKGNYYLPLAEYDLEVGTPGNTRTVRYQIVKRPFANQRRLACDGQIVTARNGTAAFERFLQKHGRRVGGV